jgi:hypothetical protein
MGKGTFQQVMQISRIKEKEVWDKVTYNVFDSPVTKDEPFEQRMDRIKKMELPPHVRVIEHIKCEGKQWLKDCIHVIRSPFCLLV